MMVWWSRRNASIPALVISPRNPAGGFIARPHDSSSGNVRCQLADPLDPGGYDVAGLEMSIRSRRRAQPSRRPRRDEVARLEADMAAKERDDLEDREAHVRGAAV